MHYLKEGVSPYQFFHKTVQVHIMSPNEDQLCITFYDKGNVLYINHQLRAGNQKFTAHPISTGVPIKQ